MLLARVKGQVVASTKDSSLHGYILYLIEAIDETGAVLGDPFASISTVSCRNGDIVSYVDSGEAPKAIPGKFAPVDACIVSIMEEM